MSRYHAILKCLVLTLLLAGCAEPVYTFQVEMGDGPVVAGEPQRLRLKVQDDSGRDHSDEAELVSAVTVPSTGVTAQGIMYTFTRATSHWVTASIQIDGQSLESTVEVPVFAADSHHVLLNASPLDPRAGEKVTFEALLVDFWDNPSAPPGSFKYSVDPSSSVVLQQGSVVFSIAGTYDLTATELSSGWEGSVPITVSPGDPTHARLEVSSNRIRPRDSVTAVLMGIDGYGNEGPITDASFIVDPSNGVAVKGNEITFDDEGHFDIGAYAGLLEEHATVTVDGTSPVLEVTSPDRATYQEGTSVRVAGTVSDALSGLKSVTLNGDEIKVSGGKFDFAYTPVTGTNVLNWVATDLNGNFITGTRSFIWAPYWTATGDALSGGLYGRLNLSTIQLLTDLIELELAPAVIEAELLALNPIATYSDSGITATVMVEEFDYSSVEGLLRPHADGGSGYLEIQLTFYNMYARLRAYGETWTGGYDITGELSAETGVAAGNAAATVSLGIPDVWVDPGSVAVEFTGFDVTFSGAFLNAIGETLERQIREEIEDVLENLILDEVPPYLEEYLAYLNYEYPIALVVGETSAELTIKTELEQIRFDDQGVTLAEKTTFVADASPRIQPNPGAVSAGAAGLQYEASPGYFISASYDALNNLLHTLWSTGLLTYAYTVQVEGGQTLTAAIDLPLCPVVGPSNLPGFVLEGSAGDILLDLYLEDGVEPTYRLSVSLVVPAAVSSGSGGLTVSVLFGDPEVSFEVLQAPARGLSGEALGAVVDELVTELLAEAELYTTDIALPELEGYQLTITQVNTLGAGWGWLTVGGNLE